MLNRLCSAISNAIQIKQSFLFELMRNVDAKLLASGKTEYIQRSDFVSLMGCAFKELNDRLLEITSKADVTALQLKDDRLPDSLKPGNLLLGQFKIIEVIDYRTIFECGLMKLPTVFGAQSKEPRSQTPSIYSGQDGHNCTHSWQQHMTHLHLFNLHYSFRA